MIKFFRHLRKSLLEKGHFRTYMLYAVGEIILVVLGILIALSINNRNNNKIERQTELKVYENISGQIKEDKGLLERVIDYNNTYLKQYEQANQIITDQDRSQFDTLVKIAPTIYKYSDFSRSGNIFQNLINSGDLKLLKNDTIIECIQRLEEYYIYINRLEENHFKIILEYGGSMLFENYNFSTGQIKRPDEFYTFNFQNLFVIFIEISKEKDDLYHRALDEIGDIAALVQKEMDR